MVLERRGASRTAVLARRRVATRPRAAEDIIAVRRSMHLEHRSAFGVMPTLGRRFSRSFPIRRKPMNAVEVTPRIQGATARY